ncbi:MAG: hypothetical protein BroJett009_15200 [Armatimonadota bacterium]|nr:MAG: hypothetical protein BroJett009_15200 [Armatimonadota bacterium]
MARSGFLGLKGRKPRAKAEGPEPAPPDRSSRPERPQAYSEGRRPGTRATLRDFYACRAEALRATDSMARSVSLGLKGRKPIAKAEGLVPVPPGQIS